MRLIPQSLVGRTVGILLLGSILIAIDVIFISSLTAQKIEVSNSVAKLGTKLDSIISLINKVPIVMRENLLQHWESENLQLQLKHKPPKLTSYYTDRTEKLHKQLAFALIGLSHKPFYVTHPAAGDDPDAIDESRLIIIAPVADGQWLEAYALKLQHPTNQFLVYISISIAVLVGLYIVAFIISRQVVKPLRQLAQFVTRFSTDIATPAMETPAMALNGPKEIRQTMEAFNNMQIRIRRYVEERMQLIAAISHDLRTPITRLRLRVERLEDANQKRKALADLDDMQNMIASTLAFIRDDSAKEIAVKTDIASLGRSICDDIADTEGDVEFSGPERLALVCKPMAMKRALTNLIDNAIKYGECAKVKMLEVDNQLRISICDRGPGIPSGEIEKVFAPFYRLDKSRNRNTGGTGLGLSVARSIIQSHGGEVTLRNDVSGLCAKISLPTDTDDIK